MATEGGIAPKGPLKGGHELINPDEVAKFAASYVETPWDNINKHQTHL